MYPHRLEDGMRFIHEGDAPLLEVRSAAWMSSTAK
jgi:hypothetical protein